MGQGVGSYSLPLWFFASQRRSALSFSGFLAGSEDASRVKQRQPQSVCDREPDITPFRFWMGAQVGFGGTPPCSLHLGRAAHETAGKKAESGGHTENGWKSRPLPLLGRQFPNQQDRVWWAALVRLNYDSHLVWEGESSSSAMPRRPKGALAPRAEAAPAPVPPGRTAPPAQAVSASAKCDNFSDSLFLPEKIGWGNLVLGVRKRETRKMCVYAGVARGLRAPLFGSRMCEKVRKRAALEWFQWLTLH
ncbi:Hypothetical predicted protein [Podarcis lilfordi]|uniref:Uncharacterized protein n=1 Tax=Podarcis lilfordi TaxID=74358 RepID=A0AA35LNP3_9SAUR|nr:Hypothetical predicted protein [Podarcis lilfordi]